MDWRYAFIGFVRYVGAAALTAALAWLGDAANLVFLPPAVAALIAAMALAVEHTIESSTGKALFGSVKA